MTDRVHRICADLPPRAVAVLVCLRAEPRTSRQIRSAIADPSTGSTVNLLGAMRSQEMVGQVAGDDRWYLDDDGIGWLETRGISVAAPPRLQLACERRAAGR